MRWLLRDKEHIGIILVRRTTQFPVCEIALDGLHSFREIQLVFAVASGCQWNCGIMSDKAYSRVERRLQYLTRKTISLVWE